MTINNEADLYEACYWNEHNVNALTRIYERASLVPAAAVIPALKVYIVLAAVKKLVVGSALGNSVHLLGENWASRLHFAGFPCIAFTGRVGWLASLL